MTAVVVPGSGSRRGRVWRRFRSQLAPMVALVVLGLICLAAVAAPLLATHDPNAVTTEVIAPPSSEHWLGTDDVGHDLYSRLLFATRFSLVTSLLAVSIALAVGMLVGLVSGYAGGVVDAVLMRVMDALMSFPGLLMALAVVGILGPGVRNAMIGIALAFTPTFARLVRGSVLEVREESYVEAARVAGCGPVRIVARHVVPNILPPVVIQTFLAFGYALLAEGALSFLGLSIQPPGASLGSLLQRGFSVINLTSRLVLIPGIVITLISWTCNVIGDGLRDALGRDVPGAT